MSLRNILTITKREFSAYFNSAIAYIYIIVFILISVNLYMIEFFLADRADMRGFFGTLPIILSVFLPAVTMRLWAEDRRGNTLELLLTFPMKTQELVIGKFMASLSFYIIALATTLTIPVMLYFLGTPDFGPMIGAYLGSIFLGAFFIAFGIFISGLCRDQIVAFITTLIISFAFVLTGTDFIAMSIDGWWPGFGTFLKQFLGCATHFESFARGIIDARDVLYFSIGIIIFLVLNVFWLEGRMRPKAKMIFTTASTICIFIFLFSNWAMSDMTFARADLTQGKIFTVSDVTKKILKELKVPVLVKYYVSPQEKMPSQLKTLEQEVIDKLDEYRIAGRGKFDYKIFHMEAANVSQPRAEKGKNSEGTSLEEQLERKGIQPFRVQSIEADQVGVRLIYSSMAVAYKERPEEIVEQVIPTTLNELEYILMAKIYRMTLDKKPSVAIVAPYQQKEMDPQLMMLFQQIGAGKLPDQFTEDEYRYLPASLDYAGYQISRIRLNKAEPIPEGTDTLVVINPKETNERQRYEINRFLYQGGSVFLAVQNYMFDYQPSGRGNVKVTPTPQSPDINLLLEKWGFQVDESILLDEHSEVISISGGAQLGPFSLSIPVKLPVHILITQEEMNQKLSITSNLPPILYLWGSAISIDEKKMKESGVASETLMTSSPQSWKIPFAERPLSNWDFRNESKTYTGPYPIAALIKGNFPNAFQGRKTIPLWPEDVPRQPEGQGANPVQEQQDLEKLSVPVPAMTQKPGKLIVIGATTILKENMMSGGGGGALNFFMNSVDALTLGEDLTKIRAKQEVRRMLHQVSPISKVWWRFFTMFLIPIVLTVIGAFKYFVRRKAKQSYLKSISLSAS